MKVSERYLVEKLKKVISLHVIILDKPFFGSIFLLLKV